MGKLRHHFPWLGTGGEALGVKLAPYTNTSAVPITLERMRQARSFLRPVRPSLPPLPPLTPPSEGRVGERVNGESLLGVLLQTPVNLVYRLRCSLLIANSVARITILLVHTLLLKNLVTYYILFFLVWRHAVLKPRNGIKATLKTTKTVFKVVFRALL